MTDAAPEGTGAKTVLVVEDTPHIRKIIAHHLLGERYAVVEAEDGVQALDVLRQRRVDLVLTDLMMPNMTGEDLLKTVRATPELAATPVVVCTARGAQEDVIQLVRLGANDYIVKPFTKGTLIAKVKKALGETTDGSMLPP